MTVAHFPFHRLGFRDWTLTGADCDVCPCRSRVSNFGQGKTGQGPWFFIAESHHYLPGMEYHGHAVNAPGLIKDSRSWLARHSAMDIGDQRVDDGARAENPCTN